jgi:pectate lyase
MQRSCEPFALPLKVIHAFIPASTHRRLRAGQLVGCGPGPVGYGAGTTGGGNKAAVNVSTLAAAQAAINSYSGSGGLVLNYTGTFNFASITDPCAQWKKPEQTLLIKDKSDITIKGANGSSANFGIRIVSDAKTSSCRT